MMDVLITPSVILKSIPAHFQTDGCSHAPDTWFGKFDFGLS